MRKLSLIILLLFSFGFLTANVAGEAKIRSVTYSCPGQVTITYDLTTSQSTDVILYYSHDKRGWLTANSITGDITEQSSGTGKTIIWNNTADNVRFGKFYFKIVVPPPPEPECVWIDGVCWATRNVDAPGTFAANPEDAGMFYQWNRNIGWSSTDPMINSNGGTTWNSSNPTGTTWETDSNVCPSGWRVPTDAEFQSLVASGSQWTTQNGVNGRIFGSDDNTIFLPAVGYRSVSGELLSVGSLGEYWSSTTYGVAGVHGLYLNSGSAHVGWYVLRTGVSVRCVAD